MEMEEQLNEMWNTINGLLDRQEFILKKLVERDDLRTALAKLIKKHGVERVQEELINIS